MLWHWFFAGHLFFLGVFNPRPVLLENFFRPKYEKNTENEEEKIQTLPRKRVCKNPRIWFIRHIHGKRTLCNTCCVIKTSVVLFDWPFYPPHPWLRTTTRIAFRSEIVAGLGACNAKCLPPIPWFALRFNFYKRLNFEKYNRVFTVHWEEMVCKEAFAYKYIPNQYVDLMIHVTHLKYIVLK